MSIISNTYDCLYNNIRFLSTHSLQDDKSLLVPGSKVLVYSSLLVFRNIPNPYIMDLLDGFLFLNDPEYTTLNDSIRERKLRRFLKSLSQSKYIKEEKSATDRRVHRLSISIAGIHDFFCLQKNFSIAPSSSEIESLCFSFGQAYICISEPAIRSLRKSQWQKHINRHTDFELELLFLLLSNNHLPVSSIQREAMYSSLGRLVREEGRQLNGSCPDILLNLQGIPVIIEADRNTEWSRQLQEKTLFLFNYISMGNSSYSILGAIIYVIGATKSKNKDYADICQRRCKHHLKFLVNDPRKPAYYVLNQCMPIVFISKSLLTNTLAMLYPGCSATNPFAAILSRYGFICNTNHAGLEISQAYILRNHLSCNGQDFYLECPGRDIGAILRIKNYLNVLSQGNALVIAIIQDDFTLCDGSRACTLFDGVKCASGKPYLNTLKQYSDFSDYVSLNPRGNAMLFLTESDYINAISEKPVLFIFGDRENLYLEASDNTDIYRRIAGPSAL